MVNFKHKGTPVRYGKTRKGMTVPNQSMTIKEIVNKFVKNIPVSGTSFKGEYFDQSEFDLERLARLSPLDKAYEAGQFSERASYLEERIKQSERVRVEREKEAKRNESKAQSEREKPSPRGSGIDPLDNTMPVDTSKTTK